MQPGCIQTTHGMLKARVPHHCCHLSWLKVASDAFDDGVLGTSLARYAVRDILQNANR
jgi:hypothetical protein